MNPMDDKPVYRYTAQEFANIVENEGLGYAILNYMNPADIEEGELRDAAMVAAAAMEKIWALLPEPNEEGW